MGTRADDPQWVAMVEDEAADEAAPGDLAVLEGDRVRWLRVAQAMLRDTEDAIEDVAELADPVVRAQAIADLSDESARLAAVVTRLAVAAGLGTPWQAAPPPSTGDGTGSRSRSPYEVAVAAPTGPPRLQGSWVDGGLVLWGGGAGVRPLPAAEVVALGGSIGADTSGWTRRKPVIVPGGDQADAWAVPLERVLGWLVAVATTPPGEVVAPSLRWLGEVAAWAVELVATGRAVPIMRRSTGGGSTSRCRVRWSPALVDKDRLDAAAARRPGAVAITASAEDAAVTARSVLGAVVDTLFRLAAARAPSIPSPPDVTTAAEVGESILAGLAGERFEAAERVAGMVEHRLNRWARAVTAEVAPALIVRLAEPDSEGVWLLSVHVPGIGAGGGEMPVEVAMGTARGEERRAVEVAYGRLERLVPVISRPGRARRGEVALSDAEAWELLTEVGPALEAAGFSVQVPRLLRRSPSPVLRLFTKEGGSTHVGANQLVDVRWSVLIGDLELDAADIARLAAQATPLVRTGGRWVALERADLVEAAAALAERSRVNQMTGGAVLREALGLEGSGPSGGIRVDGQGWAADLLREAGSFPPPPADPPQSFRGVLRAYQAEALGWLTFLDRAGLGGCLALDMGLGKTATVLARIASTSDQGPTLAVVPQAVLSNWAAESNRFTPSLRVAVHHGSARSDDLVRMAASYDLVVTTFGTAVRDIDSLAAVKWDRVVIDEAQNIKNPASETAKSLRRLPARSRLALTGTPVENGLGDLWAILDYTNPGLVGARDAFVGGLSGRTVAGQGAEAALRALNGLLVFRRTKSEPEIGAELPDKIDELERCAMTTEQIGLYQAVLDKLVADPPTGDTKVRNGRVLAAITALKQICDHPAAYTHDDRPLAGRSGKLTRLEQVADAVRAAGEKLLVFTHFASWGERLAGHLAERYGEPVGCYHGGLARGARDKLIEDWKARPGGGILVLSLKAGGTGLNLTEASHVVLYDRWWNPAVEDQARDRAWRIGQERTVVSRRFVCPGTIDERVEEVVAGKRRIADLVLPASSSLADLSSEQLRVALGLRPDQLVADDDGSTDEEAAA